jgi:hypothetical protein
MSYNVLNEPWFESPFFYQLLRKKKTNSFLKKIAISMHENGYAIFNSGVKNQLIDNINEDISVAISKGEIKKNPKIYHYNKFPRIVEAWRFSRNVTRLALNLKLKKILRFLYDSKPLPFSTINFIGGTEQPIHSDYIHFGSLPHKYLAGAWIALEDINNNNGPLSIIPKSHKLPLVDYQDLKISKPTDMLKLEKNYRVYEKFIKNLIEVKKLKSKKLNIKKGEIIIWAANLLHGGTKMINKKLTRKSQVVHFHFDKGELFYNPGFSEPKKGIYVERKLDIVRN